MGILAGLSYLMGTGQAGTITYPKQGQNPGLWTTARLTNASPFPVVIRLGGQYLDTLPAWTANVYPLVLPGQGQGVVSSSPPPLTYQCVTPANAPPAGSGDSTLYTDFGLYGDQFLGTYPQPLAGQAVAAAVAGTVTTLNPFSGLQQLYNSPSAARGAGFTSPVINANNAQQILVHLTFGSATTQDRWTITWYLDAAGTQPVGSSQTWQKAGSQVDNVVGLRVYGPYFTFNYLPNGANNTTVGISIFGFGDLPLNPSAALSTGAQAGLLADLQNQAVANNTTGTFTPNLLANGEFDMFSILSSITANTAIGIDVWTGAAWDVFVRPPTIATGTAAIPSGLEAFRFTLPFSDWRISVPNFSGAGINFYCTIVGRAIP